MTTPENPFEEREYDDASMNENGDVLYKSISELVEEVEGVVNKISTNDAKLKSLRDEICKNLILHSWYEATKTGLSSKRSPDNQKMNRGTVLRVMLNNIDSNKDRDEAKEVAMELVLVTRNWITKNER